MLNLRLFEYRCEACGAVDELHLEADEATEERRGFCGCRQDGMPVKKVRIDLKIWRPE